jgi:predicted DNA-binding transcriptional regulator YafY
MRQQALSRAAPDVEVLTQAEGIAIRPGPRPLIAAGLLAEIRNALLSSREIDIAYARPGHDPAIRRLRPLGLLYASRSYLLASVVGTPGEPTLFRLDRIEAVSLRAEAFTRDPDFDLSAWASRSFGVFQNEPDEVVLRFSDISADEARAWHFHSTQVMEDLPDGRLLVRFTACGRLEMIHHLATWAQHVEVLEPADLRREVAAWARRVATHHRRVPMPTSRRRVSPTTDREATPHE